MVHTSKLLPASLSVALLAAATLVGGQAQAATILRNNLIQAVASCQGNLPNSEGSLRKRPLAVANEGTTSAFVTCGFQDINNNPSGTQSVTVYFINNSAADVTVNCTLVNGILNAALFDITYLPKSIVVTAGNVNAVGWSAGADNEGTNFVAPSLSCALPGKTDLSLINHVFPEEIGG